MSKTADYTALTERLNKLRERRAVLTAKEEEKAKLREALTTELKAKGIDTDHPEEEAARLEREAEEELRQAISRIDQFERELEEASEPNQTPRGSQGPALSEGLTKSLTKDPKPGPRPTSGPPAPQPAPEPKATTNDSLLDDLEID